SEERRVGKECRSRWLPKHADQSKERQYAFSIDAGCCVRLLCRLARAGRRSGRAPKIAAAGQFRRAIHSRQQATSVAGALLGSERRLFFFKHKTAYEIFT